MTSGIQALERGGTIAVLFAAPSTFCVDLYRQIAPPAPGISEYRSKFAQRPECDGVLDEPRREREYDRRAGGATAWRSRVRRWSRTGRRLAARVPQAASVCRSRRSYASVPRGVQLSRNGASDSATPR